ncbi:amidohydrolase family protein [Microbacterium sp. E-13]|uniref:amidohydrolase family protein n=1 Tax=Microbacterium sp. E-13 TaxID=3404048 RepID=UPI003CF9671E
MIIDSHMHVWDRGRARYDWLAGQSPQIDRDVDFEEIEPTLARYAIDGVVLVQSADNAADTANMLATADAQPRVLGVVGWAPLEDPAAAASRIADLRADPRIVGVRNLVHDRADPDWVVRPGFDAGLALLADCHLPFDYVTSSPDALRHLVHIGEKHPELTIVIDHLGKPPIGRDGAAHDAWVTRLAAAAANPRVVAKISGLYASTGPLDGWTDADLERAVDAALEIFRPERLMYGGDWPVSSLAGGYSRVWTSLRTVLERALDQRDLALVLGANAQRIYRLKPHSES